MSEADHSSTHPTLPPTTEDDQITWLRLLRSRRVGISTFYRLIATHGSAAQALEALPSVAAAAGVRDYRPCPESAARAEMRLAARQGAQLLCIGSPRYPRKLMDMRDAPPMLWAMGDLSQMSRPTIAIVGARNASSLGTRMARLMARELGSEGFVIVSGLARGTDTAAHEAALPTGTIAVMAGGVDVIYPPENAVLAQQILTGGFRLSEQPMGTRPLARHFPVRNRLISGLSCAVIVTEAAVKSGSLITARTALDQGRDVMAVPGHPLDGRAGGCNLLLRDGATLVRSAQDVLEALPPLAPSPPAPPRLPLPEGGPAKPAHAPRATSPAPPPRHNLREAAALHRQILERLGPSPVAEDQLIRDLHQPARHVAPALTELEIDGKIQRQAGGMLSLVPTA